MRLPLCDDGHAVTAAKADVVVDVARKDILAVVQSDTQHLISRTRRETVKVVSLQFVLVAILYMSSRIYY